MRTHNRFRRARAARTAVGALLVVSTFLYVPEAFSSPRTDKIRSARHNVETAQAQLSALNRQADLLDEQYNQAVLAMGSTQRKLDEARSAAASAQARAAALRSRLDARARQAYEGMGSDLGLILGANSYSQFSDRLAFMNQISANDTSLVTLADVARQRAAWASRTLARAVRERSAAVRALRTKKAQLLAAVAKQRALLGQLQVALHKALLIPKPRPVVVQANVPPPSSTSSSGAGGGSPPAPPPPPPNASKAEIAIAAAKSVLGVPYVYAGASPQTGFDCSGLTMWAWAHAGVYLPHSAAMQYAMLPHVSRSNLQPGDLVFFYSPIHHVAMYLGGGMMIEAPHTGAFVRIVPVYWPYYVGAGRPG